MMVLSGGLHTIRQGHNSLNASIHSIYLYRPPPFCYLHHSTRHSLRCILLTRELVNSVETIWLGNRLWRITTEGAVAIFHDFKNL